MEATPALYDITLGAVMETTKACNELAQDAEMRFTARV